MKKKIILLPFLCALFYVVLSSYQSGPGLSGSGDLTGASGSAGCSCHDGSPTSTTTVQIQLDSAGIQVFKYVPGNSYTIRLTGTQTSGSFTLPRFGFQLSAVVSGSTTNAGTLSAPSGTHLGTYSSIRIVEHNSAIAATTGIGGAGTTYVMNIPWTAPSAGTGCVNFFSTLMSVNFNGNNTGDKWNNTSYSISEQVPAIGGTTTVCVGGTTTLTETATCGTWASGNTAVATIGSTTGVVTGVSAGTAVITYGLNPGNYAVTTITVNPAPTAISGTTSVCLGQSTSLIDIYPGGTWQSSNTAIATVGSTTGVVTGISTGTVTMSYILSSTGCRATTTFTVLPLPAAISGGLNVCLSGTSTVTDATAGGLWSSGNTAVATIGSTSGILTGVSLGTSIITYRLSTGCLATAVATVNPLPGAISGTASACPGNSSTLTNTGGGTWSSSNTAIVTIGSTTGVATGVSSGTATITYALPGTGCASFVTYTVHPLPGAISGSSTVCLGATTTLTDAGGGTWSSSNSGIAAIGSTTGVVTGAALGTATITYTLPTTGCTTTAPITVNPLPAAITGATNACIGATATLADATPGGTWSSSDGALASIDGAGTVFAIGAGTTTITYALPTGCFATTVFTINPPPSSITGTTTACIGATTTLSDATSGGTWISSNTAVATIGSLTGVLTGVTSGATTITYRLATTGCYTTTNAFVNPLPSAIGGTTSLCQGNTTTLTNTGGGTWSSSSTGVATIGSTTGLVTGVSAGTSVITYTLPTTGCRTTTIITVNPLPSSISGIANACIGSTSTLSNSGGGTWASSNGNATVGSTTGVVTGVTAGTSIITYTLPGTGCRTTIVFTVNPLPAAITGTTTVCQGATTSLSATGGGTWTSGNTAVATIGSLTGLVTGVSEGTSVITYTIATGCSRTATVTVNPLPSAITGPANICLGLGGIYTNSGGGTWSSGNTGVAIIGSATGLVTTVTAGTSTITYRLPTGCITTQVLTVNPRSAIGGLTSICAGLTTTLTNTVSGGTWISGATGIATIGLSTGVLSAIAAGTTTITYTTPLGCVSTSTATVVSGPSPIVGNTNVCLGGTSALTNSGGGTWTSSAPAIANVGLTSGVVGGIALGTATISYSLGTGCAVTTVVTVTPTPAAITGTATVCEGLTTTLADATAGGTWSSSNANATVGATTGIVTGVSAGIAVISYIVPSGCFATRTVTINATPTAIGGTLAACVGGTTTLTNSISGGRWTSGSPLVATVGSVSGIVSGLTTGTSTISYTLSTGCMITDIVTINPLPAAITGASAVCVGATTAYTDATPGGVWSSSATLIADVDGAGNVTGIAAGTATITYTIGTGCIAVRNITVNPIPGTITGTTTICTGQTTTLTDAGGGAWSSGATGVAVIGSTTGVALGVAAGTADITYTLPTGCIATTIITVNPTPAAITGSLSACVGATSTLADATAGGVWSSGSANATIGSASGIVTGVTAGTSVITYRLGTGCIATALFTIHPLPAAITGAPSVCVGLTTTLSSTTTGGTWSSSSALTATVGSASGIVTGIAAGTSIITYALPTGCLATASIIVNPLPAAIAGTTTICAGATTTLTNTTSGGSWISGAPAIATIGSSSGLATGIAAGTTTITYALPTGCIATTVFTVNAAPSAIGGTTSVCQGATTTLSNSVPGGTWSSGSTGVATIGSTSGIATGVSAGTSTITYQLPTGCSATTVVTVRPLPAAIGGTLVVCAGANTTLTNTVAGGAWSSGSTGIATIGSATGIATGVSAGTTVITYTLPTGCAATATLSVNPLPVAGTISGPTTLCAGSNITLTPSVTGGSWTSSNTAIATVAGAGAVTGVAAGIVTITYSVTNSCGTANATYIDTVIALPTVDTTIVGADSVCEGDTIHLFNPTLGGDWSSSNTAIATVGSTGIVTGVASGIDTIRYSVTTPCGTATARLVIKVKSHAECYVSVTPTPAALANIAIYPNPSNGIFTIEIPATQQGATISVFDITGKAIAQTVTDNRQPHNVTLNLSAYAAGSYIVRINAGNLSYRQMIEIMK